MSFCFYRQHDAMQCGIACMAMLCKFYGRMYSCENLSHICAITNEGVSMQALKQLAEALGFDVLCEKASLYHLNSAAFFLVRYFYILSQLVSIQYSPPFSCMLCFLPLCKKYVCTQRNKC